LHVKIDVEVRPIEVMGLWAFHMENAGHRGIAEPGKVLEGKKDLAIPEEQPDPVG
jgi:hypothetical protein